MRRKGEGYFCGITAIDGRFQFSGYAESACAVALFSHRPELTFYRQSDQLLEIQRAVPSEQWEVQDSLVLRSCQPGLGLVRDFVLGVAR